MLYVGGTLIRRHPEITHECKASLQQATNEYHTSNYNAYLFISGPPSVPVLAVRASKPLPIFFLISLGVLVLAIIITLFLSDLLLLDYLIPASQYTSRQGVGNIHVPCMLCCVNSHHINSQQGYIVVRYTLAIGFEVFAIAYKLRESD